MVSAKQQQQHRRAVLRRVVGNQRLLLVGVFLLAAWFMTGEYWNDRTEDQNFINTLFSYAGFGHGGSQEGYTPGARVGRGWFSSVYENMIPVALTFFCLVSFADEDGMAYSVDYMYPGYKGQSEKTKYHVLLPCDGRVYHEWQARVVCILTLSFTMSVFSMHMSLY